MSFSMIEVAAAVQTNFTGADTRSFGGHLEFITQEPDEEDNAPPSPSWGHGAKAPNIPTDRPTVRLFN